MKMILFDDVAHIFQYAFYKKRYAWSPMKVCVMVSYAISSSVSASSFYGVVPRSSDNPYLSDIHIPKHHKV